MYNMVNHVKDHLQSELVGQLYINDKIGTLLTESHQVAQKREDATLMLQVKFNDQIKYIILCYHRLNVCFTIFYIHYIHKIFISLTIANSKNNLVCSVFSYLIFEQTHLSNLLCFNF